MSQELDSAYANLLFQQVIPPPLLPPSLALILTISPTHAQVPAPWGQGGKGYPSLKPLGSWFKDLLLRVSFMREWLEQGPPPSFWVSAFFFPQGFFTSALQAHARRYQLPIDVLRFGTEVTSYASLEQTPSAPDSGVHIHGMVMEGARFDCEGGVMAESRPGELFAHMNVVWLKPVDLSEQKLDGHYECPFYKTNVRAGVLSTTGHSTNHVCNFLLPSLEEPQHWMRRGAALISQTND